MAQRGSGYTRRPNEDYATPAWVTAIIAKYLRSAKVREVWEPAPGAGALADALLREGFGVTTTPSDFLDFEWADPTCAIVTNPPYGADCRSDLACAFIRHALRLKPRIVAMLLRVDFDSAKTRADLFRDNPIFAGKIVLLDRIKWFTGNSGPSDNHAWFVWKLGHNGQPWVTYAEKGPPKVL
jgi:hypothetical protein